MNRRMARWIGCMFKHRSCLRSFPILVRINSISSLVVSGEVETSLKAVSVPNTNKYIFESVTGCPACTSPGSLILGRLSLSSLWILPPSLILPHILVTFTALIQFLTCTGTGKTVGFSGFLHLL